MLFLDPNREHAVSETDTHTVFVEQRSIAGVFPFTGTTALDRLPRDNGTGFETDLVSVAENEVSDSVSGQQTMIPDYADICL